MYALYSAAFGIGVAGYATARALRGGHGHSAPLKLRRGHFDPGLPPEPRCWVHAVSVGEAVVAAPLVQGIRRRWPGLGVVMTTVTRTGAEIVAERLGDAVAHRYLPLDLPGPVGRALDTARPRFFVAMETELWPNLLRGLERRGVPVMIANGRLSDRSFRRYRRVRLLMRRVLRPVTVFGMQSDEDARRVVAIGAPAERVVVTGSLKADLGVYDAVGAGWTRALGIEEGSPLLVAGSTHRGEEAAVLEAFLALRGERPGLRLVLAPRHTERAAEVEALVRSRGLAPVRRSAPGGAATAAVVILDTVGELASLYGVASVAFVGGSLVPVGGHNMLEAAARGCPVIFGPHTGNFRESAALLVDAGAALIVDSGEDLRAAAGAVLDDPGLAARMGAAGRTAVASRQGGVETTLDLIERRLLGGAGGRNG